MKFRQSASKLYVFTFAILAVVVSSCGPSKPPVKELEYPPLSTSALDPRYFHSAVGDLAGHFPNGWLLVNMENLPDFSNVIFVYTDPARENALILSEIPGTAELRRNVERDGLPAIAQASFQLKLQKTTGKVEMTKQPEVFSLQSKLFSTYEYTSSDSSSGVTLQDRAADFTTGIRFYELAIVELRPNEVAQDTRKTENFRLLQTVLGGLEGVAEIRKLDSKAVEAAP